MTGGGVFEVGLGSGSAPGSPEVESCMGVAPRSVVGCVVASFELDVRGGSFGWRQPLSLISIIAIVIGPVPPG